MDIINKYYNNKTMISDKSTAQQFSFESWHTGISSTNLKVWTILYNQESVKGNSVNPPDKLYSYGNPSQVIFRYGAQFFHRKCYYARC